MGTITLDSKTHADLLAMKAEKRRETGNTPTFSEIISELKQLVENAKEK